MATLMQIMDALASQIQAQLSGTASPLIPELQVDGRLVPNPTPPAVDVYPADPFQEQIAYGKANNEIFLTIRVRVLSADHEGQQDLLLSMMDPEANTSMARAVLSNRTLGGIVERINVVEGPSAFGIFTDSGGQGNLLGCTWRAQVFP